MKKKARVFINMHYLELGGAETALIGLLGAIDYDRVSVDLFLNDHRGELLSYIPQKVHLLPIIPSYSMLERPIVELFRKGYWRIAVARLLAKFDTWRDLHRNILHKDDFCCFFNMAKRTTPLLPFINPETNYDLAISFLAPHQIVADKVLAKRKVAWIHTDYTNVYVRPEKEVAVWRCFDAIASISDEVTTKFVQVFPSLRKEVFVFENILPIDMIHNRANAFVPEDMLYESDTICLLSIGRYSHPKRFDEIPIICKKTLPFLRGKNLKWYIIGYGGDEHLILQRIAETEMEEHVILLGKRTNPYPYIKFCHYYVQPSRYEGKSISVQEAQLLCKPVIITDYPTARSQVQDGIDGVIIPMQIDACARKLAESILDESLRDRIIAHLQNKPPDYSMVQKLYSLCNVPCK